MPAGKPESGFAAVISVNHCQSGSSPDYSTEPVVEPRKAFVSYVPTGAPVNNPGVQAHQGWWLAQLEHLWIVAVSTSARCDGHTAGRIYLRREWDRLKVAIPRTESNQVQATERRRRSERRSAARRQGEASVSRQAHRQNRIHCFCL